MISVTNTLTGTPHECSIIWSLQPRLVVLHAHGKNPCVGDTAIHNFSLLTFLAFGITLLLPE